MKKVIGILYDSNFNENSFYTGCGGSETWAIQISKEFVSRGYYVIIFSNYENWFIYESGVEYVPLNMFYSRIEYQHFDYFIFTRCVYKDYYEKLVNNGCTNIYVQSHDMFVWNTNIYDKKYKYIDNEYPYIKKYIALTNFHKWELMHYNNIPKDKIEVIGNGLDSDIFNEVEQLNINVEKDNEILWTSAFGRGGNILVDYILPIVKNEIPDFKVNICGYADNIPDEIKNNKNVNILGTLTKEEYYKEFMKHKVWFLPCVVVEDFGICAAEAVMCGAHVVSPYLHGMQDVLSPFLPFAMQHKYNIIQTDEYHYGTYKLEMSYSDFRDTNNEAAYAIINIIKNYDNILLKKILASQKKYVTEKYTWENIVNDWIKMFKLNA